MTKAKTDRLNRVICFAAVIIMFAAAMYLVPQTYAKAAETVASGTWGTCQWVYDSDSTLTIESGTGVEAVYNSAASKRTAPWYNSCYTTVTKIVINGPVVLPQDSSYLFSGYPKLKTIEGLNKLDTYNVTDFEHFLSFAQALTTSDFSSFYTSNVTNFNAMFYHCESLTSLNVNSFNTSNATSCSDMFGECYSLTSLDLGRFDTANITDMHSMFMNCKKLETLNVGSFITSNAEDLSQMFFNCEKLKEIDLLGFDTRTMAANSTSFLTSFFTGTKALEKFTVGSNFSFNEGGVAAYPMAPTTDRFPGTTGKWRNIDTGETFFASEIPDNTAATYIVDYAYYAPTFELPVTKDIDGTPQAVTTEFTFSIAADEQNPDAPLPNPTTCSVVGSGTTKFAPITFTEPGRYFYVVSETAGEDTEYAYDDTDFIVCIDVKNKLNGSGIEANLIGVWRNVFTGSDGKLERIVFTNIFTPAPGSLILSKLVTGELGDPNLGFAFTIKFSDSNYNYNAGEKGYIKNGKGTITLKDTESVTFPLIPAGTTYEIKEIIGAAYTTKINNNGYYEVGKNCDGIVTRNSVVKVVYTNDRPYIPIIGVTMNTIPFILLGMFAFGGVAIIVVKKRKLNKSSI